MNTRLRNILLFLPAFISACGAADKYLSADNDKDGYTVAMDCDDGNPKIHPNADEICNAVDDDCDGLIDDEDPEIQTENQWYLDSDSDGFGIDSAPVLNCLPPEGYVANKQDCNDANIDINPEGIEICNGEDDNCDGDVDDNPVDGSIWYLDSDGDGHGVDYATTLACSAPISYSDTNNDCDDFDALVYPHAPEICDGVDNDCNGYVDTEDPNIDLSTTVWFYPDHDGDGFGGPASEGWGCSLPDGFVSNNSDCNDSDADVNPNALEICDGQDNDCNTDTPETNMASEMSLNGWVDVSPLFVGSPAEISITQDTELLVCPGYYDMEFSIEANLDLSTVDSATVFSNSNGVVFNVANTSTVLIDGVDVEYSSGVINCSNSNVTFRNGAFVGQYSLGNSIFEVNSCDLTFESMLIEGNRVYANRPFFSADASSLDFFDSQLLNNVNGQGSTGIYLNQTNLVLEHTTIIGQQGGLHHGVLLNNSQMTCVGSQQLPAGIYLSSMGGAQSQSAALEGNSALSASDCQFGGLISAGEDAQAKILVGNYGYGPVGSATLTCDQTGCSGQNSEITSNPSFISTPSRLGFAGNVYSVSGNPTVLNVAFPVDANGHCDVQFGLWTRASGLSPWALKWTDTNDYWSGDLIEFTDIGIMLKDNEEVAFGVSWSCDLNVAMSNYETGSTSAGTLDFNDVQLATPNFSGQNLATIGLQESSSLRQISLDVEIWENQY